MALWGERQAKNSGKLTLKHSHQPTEEYFQCTRQCLFSCNAQLCCPMSSCRFRFSWGPVMFLCLTANYTLHNGNVFRLRAPASVRWDHCIRTSVLLQSSCVKQPFPTAAAWLERKWGLWGIRWGNLHAVKVQPGGIITLLVPSVHRADYQLVNGHSV